MKRRGCTAGFVPDTLDGTKESTVAVSLTDLLNSELAAEQAEATLTQDCFDVDCVHGMPPT